MFRLWFRRFQKLEAYATNEQVRNIALAILTTIKMLRRTPTRVEFKIDDLDEYEAFKKKLQVEKSQKSAAESSSGQVTPEIVGSKSRVDVHQRIGYDPKPLPQPSRLPH
jgi:anaphase-promoting complex subunit 12